MMCVDEIGEREKSTRCVVGIRSSMIEMQR